jgi:hypothetical protein
LTNDVKYALLIIGAFVLGIVVSVVTLWAIVKVFG